MAKRGKVKTYQRYSPEVLDAAIAAVKSKKMSQRKAAKLYKVPQATISNRITEVSMGDIRPGRPQIIPEAIENVIAEKVVEAADQGFGTSRVQLLQKVGRVVKKLHMTTPFRNQVPGKVWFSNFKKRNPTIALRKPEKTPTTRLKAMNPTLVGNYFVDLQQLLHDLELEGKPHHVWNMDETNVSFEHDPVRVVARKGAKQVAGRTSNSRESSTIIVGGNAAGRALSPLIIMKGKTSRTLLGVNVTEGPTGAKWTFQANAWTEDILGIEWFKKIFLAECGPSRPQLLILDGHHSHETLGLLEMALEEKIVCLCLPAHTTAYLNPLDRTVFGPFKTSYNTVVSEYLSQSPMNLVTKYSWPALLKQAYTKAVTASNLIAGFRACGILPWNPLALPSTAFSPRRPFHNNGDVSSSFQSSFQSSDHPLSWVLHKVVCPGDVVTAAQVSTELPTLGVEIEIPLGPSGDHAPVVDLGVILGVSNTLTIPEASTSIPEASTSAGDILSSWHKDVSEEFPTPVSAPSNASRKQFRHSSEHRVLTTNEVVSKKKRDLKEKEDKETEKQLRKKAREDKKEEAVKKGKGKGGKLGKGRKTTKTIRCKYCLIAEEGEGTPLMWVACDVCLGWMHQDCVPLLLVSYMQNTIQKNIRFECYDCWFEE